MRLTLKLKHNALRRDLWLRLLYRCQTISGRAKVGDRKLEKLGAKPGLAFNSMNMKRWQGELALEVSVGEGFITPIDLNANQQPLRLQSEALYERRRLIPSAPVWRWSKCVGLICPLVGLRSIFLGVSKVSF